jgi:hypothetical protein
VFEIQKKNILKSKFKIEKKIKSKNFKIFEPIAAAIFFCISDTLFGRDIG